MMQYVNRSRIRIHLRFSLFADTVRFTNACIIIIIIIIIMKFI